MSSINLDMVNRLVLQKQHLTEESMISDVVQIVRDIGGLHATNSETPYLSLLARSRGFTREHLDEEQYVKRNLGKIRCMRGTIYILAKEMIPTAYAATRKMLEKSSRRYVEYRGVSAEKYNELSKLILGLLEGKEMTASEIRRILGTRLDVSAILYLMCDQALLIRSKPDRYSLFLEHFPDLDLSGIDEEKAVTQLVLQYLSSFGPVTENDIAWWTGLGKTKILQALSNIQRMTVRIRASHQKGDFILLNSDQDEVIAATRTHVRRTINLLPCLDPYLMGYRKRERYVRPEYYNRIFDRSGNVTSTILLDGRVIGVWDFEKPEPRVKIYLFEKVGRSVFGEICFKAQEIGKFIAGKEVPIRECSSMITLTQRTAGAVMSPLKGC